MEFKVGDKVVCFCQADTNFYPRIGTIGTITEVNLNYIEVQWPKGTTHGGDKWYVNPKYVRPKVVTLCGSTKFKAEFEKAMKELTLKGYIVLTCGLFGHADGEYQDTITPEVKTMLDELHKRKIDLSDEIYVINKDGYIGESTQSEIEYAKQTGKKVVYRYAIMPEVTVDFNIGDVVP